MDFTNILEVIKSFGWPTAILIFLAYCGRKFIFWIKPHLEAMIAAWIKRQELMAENWTKLTDACISLQKKGLEVLERNSITLEAVQNILHLGICRHKEPPTPIHVPKSGKSE